MERREDIVDNSPMEGGAEAPARPRTRSDAGEMGSQAKERATEMASQAQEKAAEMGGRAQEQAETGKEKAASGMESAAEKLRERAETSEGVQAKASARMAEGMEKTAGYLKEHDTQEILDDVERYVREHPMQALAGAAIGGFVLARILR